jgi:hypothetical protein
MDANREASFDILADALEHILRSSPADAEKVYRSLRSTQATLHKDVVDVLANVSHFVSDSDVRERDEDYRAMQESTMRNLISALRQRAPRERLLTFSFLG